VYQGNSNRGGLAEEGRERKRREGCDAIREIGQCSKKTTIIGGMKGKRRQVRKKEAGGGFNRSCDRPLRGEKKGGGVRRVSSKKQIKNFTQWDKWMERKKEDRGGMRYNIGETKIMIW